MSAEPRPDVLARLGEFKDEVYLHQTVIRDGANPLLRFQDLPPALEFAQNHPGAVGDEWRIHFHIPLHAEPEHGYASTGNHISSALDILKDDPSLCSHLEMETYTWEVLPEAMRAGNVVDQLENEYRWTLGELRSRGLYSG